MRKNIMYAFKVGRIAPCTLYVCVRIGHGAFVVNVKENALLFTLCYT